MKTEDIDAAIDKLENNMAHTSMTLNEEKKIIAQISELRKSKAMVKELLESSGGKVDPAARETLEAQLKSVGAKITELKAQEQEQRKIMDEIKAKMGETKDEVPDLIKQKNNQWEIVKRCKETIGNLWDEHRKVENEYWTKEKAWRAQAKEERQKKWEAEQEERKKRDIERRMTRMWRRPLGPSPPRRRSALRIRRWPRRTTATPRSSPPGRALCARSWEFRTTRARASCARRCPRRRADLGP